MRIDAKFLVDHLKYSQWASERCIEAVRPLTIEEQNRHLYTSYKSVLGTLVHIYHADRIWLSRLCGSPRFTLADLDEVFTLDSLREAWGKIHEDFQKWAGALADEAVDGTLKYVNLAGQHYELPVWQVILHVVNHATYHRGQVTTLLRQLNHIPAVTDLSAYYNRNA
jgi:uncharacterized damage-inducible protein DinB